MSEGLVLLYVRMLLGVLITGVALWLRLRWGRPTVLEIALEELEARYARGEIGVRISARCRKMLGRGEAVG